MEPLFSKLLTTTDVQKRLAIPTDCLKHFPSYEGKYSVPLRVMDETGSVWKFDCSTRKGNYPKPAFGKGWRDFVIRRGISVGDRVVLYRDVEPGVYRIDVKRKIILLGQECWCNPPPADRRRADSEKISEAETEAEVNEAQARQNIRLHPPADEEEVNFDKTTAAEAEAEAEAEAQENEEESKKNSSS